MLDHSRDPGFRKISRSGEFNFPKTSTWYLILDYGHKNEQSLTYFHISSSTAHSLWHCTGLIVFMWCVGVLPAQTTAAADTQHDQRVYSLTSQAAHIEHLVLVRMRDETRVTNNRSIDRSGWWVYDWMWMFTANHDNRLNRIPWYCCSGAPVCGCPGHVCSAWEAVLCHG